VRLRCSAFRCQTRAFRAHVSAFAQPLWLRSPISPLAPGPDALAPSPQLRASLFWGILVFLCWLTFGSAVGQLNLPRHCKANLRRQPLELLLKSRSHWTVGKVLRKWLCLIVAVGNGWSLRAVNPTSRRCCSWSDPHGGHLFADASGRSARGLGWLWPALQSPRRKAHVTGGRGWSP